MKLSTWIYRLKNKCAAFIDVYCPLQESENL